MDLEGCSDRGHDHDGGEDTIDGFWIHKFRSGTFIWIPSPGVDRIIIEKLHPAHHKNTKSAHFFVGPMLVWNKWWIDIHKSEDIIFDISVRSGYIWPQEMHEILLISTGFRGTCGENNYCCD